MQTSEFKSKSDLIQSYIEYKSAWAMSDHREETEIRMSAAELAGAYLQMHGDAALDVWQVVAPMLIANNPKDESVVTEVARLLTESLDPTNY